MSHSSDYELFKLFAIILFKHEEHLIWKIFSSGKTYRLFSVSNVLMARNIFAALEGFFLMTGFSYSIVMKFDLCYKNVLNIFPEKEGNFSTTKICLKFEALILPCILLKNGQTYFKNSAL